MFATSGPVSWTGTVPDPEVRKDRDPVPRLVQADRRTLRNEAVVSHTDGRVEYEAPYFDASFFFLPFLFLKSNLDI